MAQIGRYFSESDSVMKDMMHIYRRQKMSPLPLWLASERERELLAMLPAEDLSINISWPSEQRQAGMNGTLNDDGFIVCRQTG